jgi:hypothetical protein
MTSNSQRNPKHPHTGVLRCGCPFWPGFDYAEALLQIAIVLTSVAIIAGTPMLFGGALILGILGSLATLNGFLLLV